MVRPASPAGRDGDTRPRRFALPRLPCGKPYRRLRRRGQGLNNRDGIGMAKRRALSKRLRFEVFKRDKFTCQYCGRRPPEITLHIDHVVPVAAGGTNDLLNLLSACAACNLGKSDRHLSTIHPTTAEELKDRKERAAQVAALNEFLMESRNNEDAAIRRLGHYWCNKFVGVEEKDRWFFGESRATSIRRFLRNVTETELMEFMDIAYCKLPSCGGVNQPKEEGSFRYFCGIAWKNIKSRNIQ